MDKTLKQIIKHIVTIYGQDISNELNNRTLVTIVKPVHDKEVLNKHAIK